MRTDPAKALELRLSADETAGLLALDASLGPYLESEGIFAGDIETVVADDFERHTSTSMRWLHAGSEMFHVYGDSNESGPPCGKTEIHALRSGDRLITLGPNSVTPIASCADVTALGEQRVAVILLKFPSTGTPTMTVQRVQESFFDPAAPSLNHFWRENSYGRAWATGDVFGWFTLSREYSCDEADAIRAEAIQLADSQIDFHNYSRLFLIFPRPSSGCSYGGLGGGCVPMTAPQDGGFHASVSWLVGVEQPPRNSLMWISAHEGGHNMGLHHATTIDFGPEPLGSPLQTGTSDEYGDPFSPMGSGPGHYAAPHKAVLGWLTPGEFVEVSGNGDHTIAPLSSQEPGVKALRVRRGLLNEAWLWLENRQPVGAYDSSIPSGGMNGVLVHAESASLDRYKAHLVDHTPGSRANADFIDAPLVPGALWNDPYTTRTLRVGNAGGSGITVSIGSAQSCVTLSQASTPHGSGVETGTVAVTAPPGCVWTVYSSKPWIVVTSAATASGNGSVAYRVDANPTAGSRSGALSFGGASFTITQQGANLAPSAGYEVGPHLETGGWVVAPLFTDPNGGSDLASMKVVIGGSTAQANSCSFEYDAVNDRFTLWNDAGTAPVAVIALRVESNDSSGGYSGNVGIGNSRCFLPFIFLDTRTNGFVLSFWVRFTGLMSGSQKIFLSATDRAGLTSGFREMAPLSLTNSAPTLDQYNPSAVTSGGALSGNATFSDADGAYDIRYVRMTVGACTVEADYWLQQVRLREGSAWSAPVALNRVYLLRNPSCEIISFTLLRQNTMFVRWSLRLRQPLAGAASVNISVEDAGGRSSSGSSQPTIAVPNETVPVSILMTPNEVNAQTQTIQFVLSDPGLLAAQIRVFFRSAAGARTSGFSADFSNSRVTLDGQAGLMGSVGELQNQWMRIDLSTVTFSRQGNDLILQLTAVFKNGSEGTWGVFASTFRATPASLSPERQVGNWHSGSGTSRTVTINTQPQGMRVRVDDMWLTAPVTANWATGATHVIYTETQGNFTFYAFERWSDGGPVLNPVVASSTATSWTAHFKKRHNVWVFGSISVAPIPPGVFNAAYNAHVFTLDDGTFFQATPVPPAGSRFTGWFDDVSGTDNPLNVVVDRFMNIRANFTPIGDVTTVAGVAPNNGRGLSQVFTATFNGKGAASNLSSVLLQFAATPGSPLSCIVRYERAANRLWLNYDGSGETGPVTLGSAGTLRNGFCTVDPAASRVTVSGQALTLDVSVRFAMTRVRDIFLRAIDILGADTNWVRSGSWITGDTATVSDIPVGGGPTITGPTGGQTLATGGVTFSWNPASGSIGYNMRIVRDTGTVFEGNLNGGSSISTLVSLGDGTYVFYVRSCSGGFAESNCGGFSAVTFTVALTGPGTAPTITAPANGQNFTSSTQQFTWSPVAGAGRYEILLLDMAAGGATELAMANAGNPPPTNTIFSMHSSSNYELKVRACTHACGPWSNAVNFAVSLPPVPATAPSPPNCSVSGSQASCSWNAVANADLYILEAVQAGAGPGGGALTVANSRVAGTSATVTVPTGNMAIVAKACNGNGCGPYSGAANVNAPGPNSTAPVLGNPIGGTIVDGPLVFFSWNRVPGDNGSNTVYRLYVQDFSLSRPALDVLTTTNYWAAKFRGGGNRYDALVIANPGPSQVVGPPPGFNVKGTDPASPTLVEPRHQDIGVTNSIQASGNVQFSWTPISNASLYEYYVVKAGNPVPVGRGVSPGLTVQIPLAGSGQYSGIVRACPSNLSCAFNSDLNWGPWSNAAGGTGVTTFAVQ